MKKIILLVWMVFLSAIPAAAQDSEVITDSKPSAKDHIKLYHMRSFPMGDNVLTKANKFKGGAGISVTLYSYQNFYLKVGCELAAFDITDVALAGNFKETYATTFFGELMYKLPVAKNFTLNPKIAIGSANINQRANGESYGRQIGPAYSIGADVDYRIAGPFRVFVGVNYSFLHPETDTAAEFVDFYSNLHMVNLSLGIKL